MITVSEVGSKKQEEATSLHGHADTATALLAAAATILSALVAAYVSSRLRIGLSDLDGPAASALIHASIFAAGLAAADIARHRFPRWAPLTIILPFALAWLPVIWSAPANMAAALVLSGSVLSLTALRLIRVGGWSSIVALGALVPLALAFSLVAQISHIGALGPEKMSYGQLVLDSLFHNAVTNMSAVYGAVSTGISGLRPLDYHAGSHQLLAGFARGLGVPAIEIYSGVVPIYFSALAFGSAVWCTQVLGSLRRPSSALVAGVLASAAITLLNVAGMGSWLSSESQFLGCSLALLLLPSMLAAGAWVGASFSWHRAAAAALLVAAPLLLLLKVKPSAGFICAVALVASLWSAFVLPLHEKARVWSLGTLAASGTIVFFLLPLITGRAGMARPFPMWFFIQFPMQSIISATVIGATLVWMHRTLPHGHGRSQLFALEAIAIAAFVPATGCYLVNGAAGFFIQLATLIFAVTATAHAALQLGGERPLAGVAIPIATAVAVFAAVAIAALPKLAATKARLETASGVAAYSASGLLANLEVIRRPFPSALANGAAEAPVMVLKRAIDAADTGSNRAAVYLDSATQAVWGYTSHCFGKAFVGPAVLGRAILFGIPDEGCPFRHYGYDVYRPDDLLRPRSASDLCRKALSFNIKTVVAVRGGRVEPMSVCHEDSLIRGNNRSR